MARMLVKLRSNIALEGDLLLADLEARALLGAPIDPIASLDESVAGAGEFSELGYGPVLPPGKQVRAAGVQGYRASAPLERLPSFIRASAFAQQVYCTIDDSPAARAAVQQLQAELGPVIRCYPTGAALVLYAVTFNALLELSHPATRPAGDAASARDGVDRLIDGMMGRSGAAAEALAVRALAARATTGQISHDLHYYKAKFFPRMARALVNLCAAESPGEPLHILDPFCGSGTTLLEASLLGIRATGLDIDPLSTLIARAKLSLPGMDPALLAAEHSRIAGIFACPPPAAAGAGFAFPDWLRRNRRADAATLRPLGDEIAAAAAAVAGAAPQVAEIARVLLSDAITRRVRYRFLGTGVGRFALSFSIQTVQQMLLTSLRRTSVSAAAAQRLFERLQLSQAGTSALQADARQLPLNGGRGRFDAVVTSPPYLPAASGRESYVQARALPLIALGLGSPADVGALAGGAIASMRGETSMQPALTADERRLVDWLAGDSQRWIKADPTAQYFTDMALAFTEMWRVLRPGATAIIVSSKQSTYYRYSDRRPLLVVPVAEMLAERARLAGFSVQALHDVQLQKSSRNARPRSLDDYFETLIVLRAA